MAKPPVDDADRALGLALAQRRGELGLTQAQVANWLGVTYQAYQRYENGKNRMAAVALFRAAAILETNTEQLGKALNGERAALTPEELAARRLGRIGRRLAASPRKLEALVRVGLALVEEDDDQTENNV